MPANPPENIQNPPRTRANIRKRPAKFARPCIEGAVADAIDAVAEQLSAFKKEIRGRGLHSSTFRLNVSTIFGIRWVPDFPSVY